MCDDSCEKPSSIGTNRGTFVVYPLVRGRIKNAANITRFGSSTSGWTPVEADLARDRMTAVSRCRRPEVSRRACDITGDYVRAATSAAVVQVAPSCLCGDVPPPVVSRVMLCIIIIIILIMLCLRTA